MADPGFNLQSLHSSFQKAYEAVMSGSGSSSNGCAQKQAIAFGQQVKQTVPNGHLNNSIPSDEGIFHNPLCASRFKKVPVTAIYSQEPHLGEPSDLPVKAKLLSSQSSNQPEIKIVKVWSMAVEKDYNSVDNSHQHSNLMEQVSQVIPADNSSNTDASQTVQTQESLMHSEAVAIQTNCEGRAHINKYVSSSSEKTTDNKAARLKRQRERKRELRKDPAYAKRERERQRERQRERKRELRKDSAYAKREREYIRELRKDPVYVKREKERQRERQRERYRTDPVYAEQERKRQRERQRELRKNPTYVERQRERQRKCQRELRKNPAYVEREKERRRERKRQRCQSVNSAKTQVIYH